MSLLLLFVLKRCLSDGLQIMEKELHILARELAIKLKDPDKKQLRYNDIVNAALTFYPTNPQAGEKFLSCM